MDLATWGEQVKLTIQDQLDQLLELLPAHLRDAMALLGHPNLYKHFEEEFRTPPARLPEVPTRPLDLGELNLDPEWIPFTRSDTGS